MADPVLDPQMMAQLQGLLGIIGQANPEDLKKIERDKWLTLGLGLLGGRKGSEGATIGAAGLNAIQNANAERTQLQLQRGQNINQAMNLQTMMQQMQQRQRAGDMQKQIATALAGTGPQLGNMAPGGPTPANAAAVTPLSKVETMRKIAGIMLANGDSEGYKRVMDSAKDLEEQFSTSPVNAMQNGQPVLAQFSSRGGTKVSNLAPATQLHFADTGGMAGVGMNPYTGVQQTAGVPKTLDPNTQYTGSISLRGQDLTNARALDQNAIAQGNKQIEQVHTIRKEVNALPDVQNYRAVVPLINSAAKAPNTRAGDLDMIYAVGKALDPNSVVREGELNLIIKSGTLPQQIEGYAQAVMGGGKLVPAQRQQMMQMLVGRAGELKKAHDAALVPYVQQAQQNGLPVDQLFVQPPEMQSKPQQAAGGLTTAETAELAALRKKHGR